MFAPNLYANTPGLGYLGLPGAKQAASMAGHAVNAIGKAPTTARVAGKAGLAAAGTAAKFLGPIGLAATAVGGVLNAGGRMMNGENPVSAVGNAAYDTADFATFGLLKPAVGLIQKGGEEAGKMFFGATPEQEINDAAAKLQQAQQSGDMGGAVMARQQLSNAMAKAQGSSQGMAVDNQADYTMALANQRFGNEMDQQQQMFEQQFDNSNRTAESAFDRQRRAANLALNNSYYADAWKTNQGIRAGNAGSINRMNELGMQGLFQAMGQRY